MPGCGMGGEGEREREKRQGGDKREGHGGERDE